MSASLKVPQISAIKVLSPLGLPFKKLLQVQAFLAELQGRQNESLHF
jgi:hypothetical protein